MKTFFAQSLLLFSVIACISCGCGGIGKVTSDAKPPSHEIWDGMVSKYVDDAGWVNYKGFIKDSTKLNEYLAVLEKGHPNKSWSKNEQLAYWINAYNAFTVQIIIRNYPLEEGIKEIGGSVPFVNTTWDVKFIKIEDETYDLNNIEHGIIRKQFEEPRIHFAVNCASESCPKLRNEAYVAEKLDEQLTDQAKYFINNPKKNKITPDKCELSKLFSWFKGDFTKQMDLIPFINQYSEVKINDGAKIDHLDYSWKLNEQK